VPVRAGLRGQLEDDAGAGAAAKNGAAVEVTLVVEDQVASGQGPVEVVESVQDLYFHFPLPWGASL
jgi:hypothetical protein